MLYCTLLEKSSTLDNGEENQIVVYCNNTLISPPPPLSHTHRTAAKEEQFYDMCQELGYFELVLHYLTNQLLQKRKTSPWKVRELSPRLAG